MDLGVEDGTVVLAFLFSVLMSFLARRSGRASAEFVRNALLINAVVAMVVAATNGGASASWHGVMSLGLLALGATEVGHWGGRTINAVVGEFRSDEAWGWRTDPIGVIITILVAAALLAVAGGMVAQNI